MPDAGAGTRSENPSPMLRIDNVVKRYDGTRLDRQELDGEIVDDRPDVQGEVEDVIDDQIALLMEAVEINLRRRDR